MSTSTSPAVSRAETAAETAPTAPEILLELVDEQGRTIGTAEKLSAHQAPGQLHRAFSVFLFDARGRMLLQQRALGKYHSPGVWSNTCCGHPYPGEAPFAAAARRTAEELGAAPVRLQAAGTVTYHHPDEATGLVEKEYNHLFVGIAADEQDPDPDEVAAVRLVTASELAELRASTTFSVWFGSVLDAALPAVRELVPDAGW